MWLAVDPGRHRGVDRARGGLHHHGVVIGKGVGHRVELGLMGHEPSARPTPARVGAEPDLQPRRQVAEGDTLAPAGPSLGARPTARDDAACHTSEDGLDHDPGIGVVEHPHHLVAGDEGKAHDVFEVSRAPPVDRRQVRSADTRQPGMHPMPLRARELGGIHIGEVQRPHARTPTRPGEHRRHP